MVVSRFLVLLTSRFLVFLTPSPPSLTPDLDVFVVFLVFLVFLVFCLLVLVISRFGWSGVPRASFDGERLDGLDVTASGCSAGPFWNFSYQLTKWVEKWLSYIAKGENGIRRGGAEKKGMWGRGKGMVIYIIGNLLNQELLVGGVTCFFYVFRRAETDFLRVRMIFGI